MDYLPFMQQTGSFEVQSFLKKGLSQYILANVPRIKEDAPTSDLANAYWQTDAKCVFVVKPDGKLSAVLDDRAIVQLVADKSLINVGQFVDQLKLRGLISSIAIPPDAQMWEALRIMNGGNSEGRKLDILPVVDPQTLAPIGVVTRSNIELRALSATAA